ncbi:hypothetical protein GLAREA_02256 [Glarea lozoyensis ATCC 20868]|uniref:Uncharacterized protein n=1 Tax=Glarea lozoyensis (strain ATCC 20868 / MF5171) TaxID=1116229 RepID=S3CMB5_GLAL2|nr:uncharacterized protein GLAREA_02256 [Glarea lozoyensis ATCC 20868]EPE26344.1 hypothetical protein GLAREA_02256 [Glarea lozoyensis ATCC 20868]
MVEAFHLPHKSIETSSCVGPFFWSAGDHDEEDPHLDIVQRKSDVRKKGFTRGWEITLSHEMKTGITTGFCKGTPSSDLVECIKHFKACMSEIGHPLLLPIIMVSHDLSSVSDIKQRDARDWLRRLEHAISMRINFQEEDGYTRDGLVDFEAINRDLVECHSQVLWKRPVAYYRIIDSIKDATDDFYHDSSDTQRCLMKKLQASLLSRLTFHHKKLEGAETFADTTMQRLEIQRNASIFSTTFFSFKDAATISSAVSPNFWLYWAVTIPVTAIIVGIWYLWEKQRAARYEEEDSDLEKNIEQMERDIMARMRQRTMSKIRTWDTRVKRKEELANDPDNDYGALQAPKRMFTSLLTVPTFSN